MVVPLPDLRHFGIELPDVFVEQVVAIAPAEFVERLGDLRDLGRDDVVPDLSLFGNRRLGDRSVSVDVVAAVDEKKRTALTHRLVDLHPAEGWVDSPPLARRVSTPQEAQITLTTPPRLIVVIVIVASGAGRRDDEVAGHRFAEGALVLQALEKDT